MANFGKKLKKSIVYSTNNDSYFNKKQVSEQQKETLIPKERIKKLQQKTKESKEYIRNYNKRKGIVQRNNKPKHKLKSAFNVKIE